MQPRAREHRSRVVGKRLDTEFLKDLRAERYNPKAFPALLEEFLSQTVDHWERLELRRRCAGLQFALAEYHHRGLKELTKLFKEQETLGYSSLDDECGHLGLYAKVLADHGKPTEARALLREFAQRVDKLRGELGYMHEYLARAIKQL